MAGRHQRDVVLAQRGGHGAGGLRLTKQDPANYKFVFPALDEHMGSIFGFKDIKDRAKAIKQFKQWWEKNKDTEPYKGLKPLPLPDLAHPQDE